MKPKIDFAFKEIMADPITRIGFLSAILKLDPSQIKETHLLNTNLRKLHEDEKQGILDVRILMNDDTEIDIEIQLSELKVWADRSLFYLSKMYTEQIQKGQKYDVFKKCVSISILDFTLFPEESEFYSCFRIMEEKRLEYEAREKAIRDYNQLMFEAKQNGWKEGRKEGREEGIQVMILDNLEEGISKEKILKKLQKRFSLTAEKAANYYEKFAKNDYSTKNSSNQNQ